MGLFDRSVQINPDVIKVSRPWEGSVSEGQLDVTPDLAEKILREAYYPGQRKIDTQTVGVYTEMMRRGLWVLSDPIAFARYHKNLTLINGYHRLNAVIAYGRAVPFRIAVNECQSEEDVRSLYYRFDTVMRVRTNEQILGAVGVAAENNVNRMTATALYRAIGIIINGFRLPSAKTMTCDSVVKLRVVDMRLEACASWWDTARKLEEAIKGGQRDLVRLVLRGSVFAVALMTMKHQPEKAAAFWRGVVENDGLKKTDPRNAYVRDLMTRNIHSGNAEQGIYAASLAWNAWFEGRPASIIKVADGYTLRIAGTPITGKRG